MWTLTARWIIPVESPAVCRGTITIDGDRVGAIDLPGVRSADVDLGDVAVLPGLVNAHTHLDLSGLRGKVRPGRDFTAWLRAVIEHRRSMSPNDVENAIRLGINESLDYGTTLLGDISGTGQSWPLLAEAPLRAVVFHEFLGLPRTRAEQALASAREWLQTHPATPTCRPGLSPHAPYSAHTLLFKGCTELSRATGAPLMTHLAETAEELELLEHRSGPFMPFLQELRVWNEEGLAHSTDEVLRLCAGAARLLVAHGNLLGPKPPLPHEAAVVHCPRTHAAFRRHLHPFRTLMKQCEVVLGTDSLASNPALDVLAEMRFLHRKYRRMNAGIVLMMGTLLGARALGWEEETGSLAAGKSADLVTVPIQPGNAFADPNKLVLESDEPVRDVLFRGRWVRGPLAESSRDITPRGRDPG